MDIEIGKKIKQQEGFSALVLNPFPQKELFHIPLNILLKAAKAERLVGKLDGITHKLPDLDFFLQMFVMKDATASSQIEGTKATIIDALEESAKIAYQKTDASDILYYIKALHYGIKRLCEFPLSLRLIREIHKELMTGARATHFADPGEFRKSQNYIGGTRPDNAQFVPPPVPEMQKALHDFEKFLYKKQILPLIHISLIHSHFETIHPFLDGNGRTGRLLITLFLYHQKLLEQPVLFLSSWFKKHQHTYYQKLNDYHNGKVESWVMFFLTAVIETAQESIKVSKKISDLRDQDMKKIQTLGKRESESSIKVLSHLFGLPVVDNKRIMDWTGFTRAGAQKVIDRLVSMDILKLMTKRISYGKAYKYEKYIDIFND